MLNREQKWGMYKDVAGESGYKQKTLEQYKYIADSVKPSVRTEGLSHQHHQQVAPLEPEQQKEWLSKASENNMNISINLIKPSRMVAQALIVA